MLFQLKKSGKKRLVRNLAGIHEELERMGIFVSVSTMACTAQEALEIYGQRDAIEKCLMAGKTNVEMDKICSQTSNAMKGRFSVSFVALIRLSELKRRQRDTPAVGKARAGGPFEDSVLRAKLWRSHQGNREGNELS